MIIGQGSIARAALPLAGHGARQLNAHPVVAVSYTLESGGWDTNPECYRLPDSLKDANARVLWEGRGGLWMEHPIASPAEVRGVIDAGRVLAPWPETAAQGGDHGGSISRSRGSGRW